MLAPARIALTLLLVLLLTAAPAMASRGATPAGPAAPTSPVSSTGTGTTPAPVRALAEPRPVAPTTRPSTLPFTALDLFLLLGGGVLLLTAGLVLVYATRPAGSRAPRVPVPRRRAPAPVIARR